MEKVVLPVSQRKSTCLLEYLGHQLTFSGDFDSGNMASAELRSETEVYAMFDSGSRGFDGP